MQIANIEIGNGGTTATTRLGDVAAVTRARKDPAQLVTYANRPAVALAVTKVAYTNTLDLLDHGKIRSADGVLDQEPERLMEELRQQSTWPVRAPVVLRIIATSLVPLAYFILEELLLADRSAGKKKKIFASPLTLLPFACFR